MAQKLIEGLNIHDLKTIDGDLGSVYHAIKSSDEGFNGFGEAYFSTVNKGKVKGWKRHRKMHSNIIVPLGEVTFVVYDDRSRSTTKDLSNVFEIGRKNYKRLSIPAGVWFAFRGDDDHLNLILNVASIEHDPDECDTRPISVEDFNFHCERASIR